MQKIAFYSLILLFFSCAPQVTDPINIPPPQVDTSVEEQDYTDNPCITLNELDPSIKGEIEDAYVIYRDYMRAKDYDEAYVLWKKAYYVAPAANGRIRYQFDDGITLYKNLYKNAESQSQKDIYADSMFSIYDKRIACFPEDEYTVLGKKAFNSYYEVKGYLSDTEIYDLFKRAFDGKADEPDYFIINPFTKLLFDHVVREEITHEEGSKYALAIIDVVEKNLDSCEGKACEAWEIINDYSPRLLATLEGLEGFYPCGYYSDKYYPLYESDPANCEVITDVYRKLRYGKCAPDDSKMMTIKSSYERNCYVAPPAQGPLKKAYTALNEGRFKESISYYDEYLATSSDSGKKADIQLRISKIYYVHIKDFVKARKYALDAAKSKSNWGEPYILIGKLYASSGPLCGPGRGWDSQVVTWAAIDKFSHAKRIDPSVASEANKLINQYRKYMPSKEDIFQRSLTTGDAFKVPCWIQEQTKVRSAP